MNNNNQALQDLIEKEAIRELALLYCRGVDRKDADLLRDLYTSDATDTHGDTFDGDAESYVNFLEKSFPYMIYSGHHVCNHTISVNGLSGEGEIYALAYHLFADGKGGYTEDFMCVRYLDKYQKCDDGRWRFSQRVVRYDLRQQGPSMAKIPEDAEPSMEFFTQKLFNRGKRA